MFTQYLLLLIFGISQALAARIPPIQAYAKYQNNALNKVKTLERVNGNILKTTYKYQNGKLEKAGAKIVDPSKTEKIKAYDKIIDNGDLSLYNKLKSDQGKSEVSPYKVLETEKANGDIHRKFLAQEGDSVFKTTHIVSPTGQTFTKFKNYASDNAKNQAYMDILKNGDFTKYNELKTAKEQNRISDPSINTDKKGYSGWEVAGAGLASFAVGGLAFGENEKSEDFESMME